MKCTSHSCVVKVTALMLAFLILVSLVGCGAASQGESVSQGTTSSIAPESVAEEGIQLIDQAGREVHLEQPAQTLVSCYYITSYATIALGVSDRVVGLEKKAETRPIYKIAAPDLLEKTQVGTLKEFNVEATAALEPDLVLMPKKLMDYADTLTDLGIAVLVVDPENQDKLEEMLTLIGKVCGVEEKAQALIAYYDAQEKRLAEMTADVEKPSVYFAGNSAYLETATPAMYQDTLIRAAGGVNAAANIEGDYWTEVSYETLLAMNPDVMILPPKAAYSAEDILQDAELAELTAVKNKAVYQMPKDIEEWDSPVPSGVMGALWMTSVLHPEVYAPETFVADAEDFYHTYYGLEKAA